MTGGPAGFGTATPRILAISVAAAVKRAKSEHQRAAWTAWTTAALGRMKTMPAMETLMAPSKPQPVRSQGWEEQLAAAAAWVASVGA